MKNLIVINGTMGVGKTATSQMLKKLLPNCVFLDGDWCWDADPFIVIDETKRMVEGNIGYLLNAFLSCSAYENVVFCWVMHEKVIVEKLLYLLHNSEYQLYQFSLVCSENALTARLVKDIQNSVREPDVLDRALSRLGNYWKMDTVKIDVSELTPGQAAKIIYNHIYP